MLALGFGDAWPVIVDLDDERAVLPLGADRNVVGETHRVIDEIGDGAFEGMAPERHDQGRVPDVDADVVGAMGLAPHLGQDLADIGAHNILTGVAFGEGQIVFEHGLHLVDIGAHGIELGQILEHRQLKLEAGEHGAEIVAHAASMVVRCTTWRSMRSRISMNACAA